MSLRYPTNRPFGEADYVSFQHQEYSARGNGSAAGGGDIVLYMPAPAPAVSNPNSWSSSNELFMGPVGQFKRKLADTAAGAVMAEDFSIDGFKRGVNDTIEKFKSTKVGPMARQFGMVAAGRATGMSAQQIMSVTRGEIYNPNVEMFYNGPQLRAFDFSFQMSPESSADAQRIRDIIKEFKKWSAPEEKNGKYKLPHIWKISYGGAAAQYYNRFKPAALTNVNVQYNAGLDNHMTFEDGSPIVTGLTLSFYETELVTRKDHNQAGGM